MALRDRRQRTVTLAAVAFAAALAFAFSGPAVSAIGYPHFEVAIPGFFIVFLALHVLGWSWAKWVALGLGLLVREDAGLHYVGYFALIGLYQWRSGREPIARRALLGAVTLAAGTSAAMLVVQYHFFPLGVSMFQKSYVGSAPFSHVDAAEIGRRAGAFLVKARAIYVPMAVVGVAALWCRAPAYVLAYAACLPWVVINVVFSLTPAAQTLSLYYGFPLLVGLAWPLLAPHWMANAPRSRGAAMGGSDLPDRVALVHGAPGRTRVRGRRRRRRWRPPGVDVRPRTALPGSRVPCDPETPCGFGGRRDVSPFGAFAPGVGHERGR